MQAVEGAVAAPLRAGAAADDARLARLRELGKELREQACLTDAGRTDERHDPRLGASEHRVVGLFEQGKLTVTPDDWRPNQRGGGGRRRIVAQGARVSPRSLLPSSPPKPPESIRRRP